MNGRGRASAAITITNALPTGVGCAVGIDLWVDASIELAVTSRPRETHVEMAPPLRTPVVEEAVASGLRRYFPEQPLSGRLTVQSTIPVERGLKSSSAVSSAILLAIAQAAGHRPDPLEIAVENAGVGRRSGVSATGALDDALAGLQPGIVVTDNTRDELLRHENVPPGWSVVVYAPSRTHPPSVNLREAFAREHDEGVRAAEAARRGAWAEAMHVNTLVVERVMGYSYGELRDRARTLGALMSGVSGLGPALAVVGPTERRSDLQRALPRDGAECFLVEFTRKRGSEEGAA